MTTTTTRRRRKAMLGIRVSAETRTAFRVWCAMRGQTMNDVRRHLLTLAVGLVPRDRALVLSQRRIRFDPLSPA